MSRDYAGEQQAALDHSGQQDELFLAVLEALKPEQRWKVGLGSEMPGKWEGRVQEKEAWEGRQTPGARAVVIFFDYSEAPRDGKHTGSRQAVRFYPEQEGSQIPENVAKFVKTHTNCRIEYYKLMDEAGKWVWRQVE